MLLTLKILLVLVLIGINGFLAMAELALVSARRARLQLMANRGLRGAQAALYLSEHPGRFLSTVQIGITLVGVVAGTFSGAAISDPLSRGLMNWGLGSAAAHTLAFLIVVTVVTYVSLILGELVPKQLALAQAERLASRVAGPLTLLSRMTQPLVYLLDASTSIVLRLIGGRAEAKQVVTEEEIRLIVAEAENAGIVEPEEKAMISNVMRLGDRLVRAVMTPRPDVDWIDLDADEATMRKTIRESGHARLPAAHGSLDEVVGVIRSKDLLDAFLEGRPVDVRSLVTPAPVIHDRMHALKLIDVLKGSSVGLALVVDEYGVFEGVATSADILETIAGQFEQPEGSRDPDIVQRDDGSWLFSGSLAADEMLDRLGLHAVEEGDFHTVAGFVLFELKQLPGVGDSFEKEGWRFEVVDMDDKRIDKVLAERLPIPEA